MKKLFRLIFRSLCHSGIGPFIALSAAAVAQTTTLTINNVTGAINVPTGLTPHLDVLNVGGVPVPLLPVPQQFGAVNDGTSHPVSEWLTSGSRSRGYADLAAIQADYPHVISLTDESDWAATQQVLRLYKTVFLPPAGHSGGGYMFNRPLVTQDDGQQIIGGGRQGPYGDPTSGTRILVGPGVDGIRCETHACSIRDLTVTGSSVSIHSVASTSGAQAIITTTAPHGLEGTAVPITGNTTGTTGAVIANSSTITTANAHHLTSADWIQISGSAESGLNGIWRVRVIDSTHLKVLTTDQQELGVPTNGGSCQLVRVYEVMAGPFYGSHQEVQDAAPDPIIGIYHVIVTGGNTLAVFTETNSPVVLTTNATSDTGILYTSRHAIHFGSGDDFDNAMSSPDQGHSFRLNNDYVENAVVGIYLGNSDAGGGEGLVGSNCGIGLHVDGALDNLPFSATWMAGCSADGYRVSRNGGLTLHGGGGANNACFVRLGPDSGNSFYGYGNYFEGVQRDDGVYVEVGGNNWALIDGLRVQDGGRTLNHFHTAFSSTLTVRNSPGLRAWQKGSSQIFADQQSALRVNYQGSAPLVYDIAQYEANDAQVLDSGNQFNGFDIPNASASNVGKKVMIIPYGGGPTPGGLYEVLNITGTPAWYRIGFDNLEVTRGGTGQTSYAAGDILYATGSTTLAKLNAGINGQVLTLTSGLPIWADAPGSQTTSIASASNAINLSGSTTLAAVSDLTINPAGGVPTGKYKVIIDGAIAFGPGGAGYKWDLKGGTAIFGGATGDYRRTLQWYHSGSIYNVSVFGDEGSVSGSLADGEIWGAPTDTPAGPGAGRWGMHYEGMIHITAAGSIVFRHANTNGSGDSGQLLGDTSITLIKQ